MCVGDAGRVSQNGSEPVVDPVVVGAGSEVEGAEDVRVGADRLGVADAARHTPHTPQGALVAMVLGARGAISHLQSLRPLQPRLVPHFDVTVVVLSHTAYDSKHSKTPLAARLGTTL